MAAAAAAVAILLYIAVSMILDARRDKKDRLARRAAAVARTRAAISDQAIPFEPVPMLDVKDIIYPWSDGVINKDVTWTDRKW